MPDVFIAWSATHGRQVAAALHDGLTDAMSQLGLDIEVTFSPFLGVAPDWRKRLHAQLVASRIGVILLEPAALRSPWVAFETGFLANIGDDLKPPSTFVLILGDQGVTEVEQTPFGLFHHKLLARDSIEELLRNVLRAMNHTPLPVVSNLAEQLHARLSNLWSSIARQEQSDQIGLRAALLDLLEAYTNFGLLTDEDKRRFGSLIDVSRNAELFAELADIAVLFGRCGTDNEPDFADLAGPWALQNLIRDARERLQDISVGRIPVRNRASVRDFWLRVFAQAKGSIWTTNIAGPGSTMGNTSDRELISAQGAAVARGVTVTRVFVYDPHMGKDEILQRQSLMRDQINVGIEVAVIGEPDFRVQCDDYDAIRRIGSDDFMVIDNSYLYLTNPNNILESQLLTGRRHPTELAAATTFRTLLDARTTPITLGNVSQFPNAI